MCVCTCTHTHAHTPAHTSHAHHLVHKPHSTHTLLHWPAQEESYQMPRRASDGQEYPRNPPWAPGFLGRFQGTTELAAHRPNPPHYPVTKEKPTWWLTGERRDNSHSSSKCHLGPWWETGWSPSLAFPLCRTPATSRCRSLTGASLAALLGTKTMLPLILATCS